MKTLQHLTLEERDKITVLQSKGLSVRKIALELKRSPSTISRELNRTEAVFFRGVYIGSQTDKKVKEKWKNSHKRDNPYLSLRWVRDFIKNNLKYGYSPKIISFLLKNNHGILISHETIYQYIFSPKRKLFHLLLRCPNGRKTRNPGRFIYKGTGKNIPNRIDIDFRTKEANLRLEFGHFEADSIESTRKREINNNNKNNNVKKQKRYSCLTVLVDRLSRKTIIRKTASKTSKSTSQSIIEALKPYSLNNTLKSITYDNGCEFSLHEKINKELNCKSYFCKPYASYEKGTVENINGLIRRFFPKGTNFDNISDEAIHYVEDWINNRPMEILNYMTPNEKFQEMSVAIAS